MENVLIIGASPKPDRYAFKAQQMLSDYGHQPVLIAPRYDQIEGLPVHRHISDVTQTIDTVTLYVNPTRLQNYLSDIIQLQPKRVIFNPGTEDAAAQSQLESAGIEALEACTLVLLRTDQF